MRAREDEDGSGEPERKARNLLVSVITVSPCLLNMSSVSGAVEHPSHKLSQVF